jgi:hypothetical protein
VAYSDAYGYEKRWAGGELIRVRCGDGSVRYHVQRPGDLLRPIWRVPYNEATKSYDPPEWYEYPPNRGGTIDLGGVEVGLEP